MNRKAMKLIVVSILAVMLSAQTRAGYTIQGEPVAGFYVPPEQREQVRPVLDVPLRDPSICRGPDGIFYLTGTLSFKDQGEDFNNNDGIRLWKSADLKKWEDMGLVWKPANNIIWVRKPVGVMDRTDSLRQNAAITAPSIHYLKGTWWIAFSRNEFGTGLLQSQSGKPEGPYRPVNPTAAITSWGGSPSLFEDDDGSVYWLWSRENVFIAKMNDELSALAEAPRLIATKEASSWGSSVPQTPFVTSPAGNRGPFMYKVNGAYHLAVAEINLKHAATVSSVVVSRSNGDIYGPYEARVGMIPHSGQTSVFAGNDGQFYATYCGQDNFSAFRDRVGIVPLTWLAGYGRGKVLFGHERFAGGPLLTVNLRQVVTERGPWAKLRALIADTVEPNSEDGRPKLQLWDIGGIQAPDGYFYVTGSQNGRDYIKKLHVWRSRDLKNWEKILIRTFADEKRLTPARVGYTAPLNDYGNCYMDTKISWIASRKTFAISYTIYGLKQAEGLSPEDKKQLSGLLLSTSGTIHGPWIWHDIAHHSSHYIELEDGRTVVGGGVNDIHILKAGYWAHPPREQEEPIWEKHVEKSMHGIQPPDTFASYVEDSGTQLTRIGPFWVMLPVTFSMDNPKEFFSYSSTFMTARDLRGPWSKWRPAVPYGGHAHIFQGLDGHWYSWVWSYDDMKATSGALTLVRLRVEVKGDDLSIALDPDWTPDDYVPVNVPASQR